MKYALRHAAWLALILIASMLGARSHGADAPSFAGTWQGSLDAGAVKLRIVFDIKANATGLEGTMDSPDQRQFGLKLDTVKQDGANVTAELRLIGGTYSGTFSADGTEIVGKWNQNGFSLPLTLRRGEKIVPAKRPQEPTPPFPYQAEDITYDNAGIRLAGTLTHPNGQGPFPAVILISGSGAQDRNEDIMGHKPFLVLADHLTRQGIAVLRVDDRGVGGSAGNTMNATLADNVSDVRAGIAYLKTRKDIDAKRIGLFGHSEGAMVAPALARESRDVAFIVLAGVPGVPLQEIIARQLVLLSPAMGLSSEGLKRMQELQAKAHQIVLSTPDNTRALDKITELWKTARASVEKDATGLNPADRRSLSPPDEMIRSQAGILLTPWFRALLGYDPAEALRHVHCPVLAFAGALDMQTPPDQSFPAVEAALKAAKNEDYTLREIPAVNHMFQTAKTGQPSEYATIEETVSPVVLKLVGDWLAQHTSAQPHG